MTPFGERVPPYGGALPVPSDAIGRMRLLAIADISQGRLGRKTVFDEVFVTVRPAADLLSIDFETEKPLQLGRTGQSSAYGLGRSGGGRRGRLQHGAAVGCVSEFDVEVAGL